MPHHWLLVAVLILAGSSSVQAAGLVGLGAFLGGSFSSSAFCICVASVVPEPTTAVLLGVRGISQRRRNL
jgi:hypothetical protein